MLSLAFETTRPSPICSRPSAMAVLNLTACFFPVVLFMFNVSLTFVAIGVLAIDFTAVWFFNRLRSELARSMQQDVGRESVH